MLKLFFARKVSFINGFIFAVLISSVIAFALTKPHHFNSDTLISSTQVNENFDLLYDEVGSMLRGFIARPAADYGLACSASGLTYSLVDVGIFHRYDGNFDEATAVYTVSEPGVYRVYNISKSSDHPMINKKIVYNGTTDILGDNNLMFLETDDTLEFTVSCDTKSGSNANITIGSIYAIVPL